MTMTVEEFTRTPPHDVRAEMCVLGGMMLSRDAIGDVIEVIRADDHYRPAHQIVHEVITSLHDAGEPADAVAVAAALTRNGDIGKVGGAPYLFECLQAVPTAANAGYYARIVREAAVFRRMIEAGTRIAQRGYSAAGDADEAAEEARADLDATLARGDTKRTGSIADLARDVVLALEDQVTPGLTTPWPDLNDAFPAGVAPGEMIVVGARPAMGKSGIALNMAAHWGIDKGLPGLFASLEMRGQELTARLLAAEAGVTLTRILTRSIEEPRHWDKIAAAHQRIAGSAMVIDDTETQTIGSLRAKLREMSRTTRPRWAVVDYLQLMTSPGRVENRQAEVAAFSRGLKLLAREFDIPIVALAQINRGPEQRTDKRPMMSDLRESGAIEQDADKVILLHRDDAYEPESPRAGEMDLIIAKQRNGPTTTVTLAWQGHYCRAMSLAWEPSHAGGSR